MAWLPFFYVVNVFNSMAVREFVHMKAVSVPLESELQAVLRSLMWYSLNPGAIPSVPKPLLLPLHETPLTHYYHC